MSDFDRRLVRAAVRGAAISSIIWGALTNSGVIDPYGKPTSSSTQTPMEGEGYNSYPVAVCEPVGGRYVSVTPKGEVVFGKGSTCDGTTLLGTYAECLVDLGGAKITTEQPPRVKEPIEMTPPESAEEPFLGGRQLTGKEQLCMIYADEVMRRGKYCLDNNGRVTYRPPHSPTYSPITTSTIPVGISGTIDYPPESLENEFYPSQTTSTTMPMKLKPEAPIGGTVCYAEAQPAIAIDASQSQTTG